MKHKLLMGALLSVTSLTFSHSASAEGQNPMANGQAMAWQCAPCHGTNGQALLEAMPPLAGMPIEHFTKAMTGYRDGTRAEVIMGRVARGFNDAEIEAMAVWFQKQPLKPWEETSLEEVYQINSAEQATSTGDK